MLLTKIWRRSSISSKRFVLCKSNLLSSNWTEMQHPQKSNFINIIEFRIHNHDNHDFLAFHIQLLIKAYNILIKINMHPLINCFKILSVRTISIWIYIRTVLEIYENIFAKFWNSYKAGNRTRDCPLVKLTLYHWSIKS